MTGKFENELRIVLGDLVTETAQVVGIGGAVDHHKIPPKQRKVAIARGLRVEFFGEENLMGLVEPGGRGDGVETANQCEK